MAGSVSDIAIKISADTQDAARGIKAINKVIESHSKIIAQTHKDSEIHKAHVKDKKRLETQKKAMGGIVKADKKITEQKRKSAKMISLMLRLEKDGLDGLYDSQIRNQNNLKGAKKRGDLDNIARLQETERLIEELIRAEEKLLRMRQQLSGGVSGELKDVEEKTINWTLAMGQGSYAIEDFMATIETMGVSGAMRGAGNNLSQMARIIGGTGKGAIYGALIGVTIGVLPMFINMLNKTKDKAKEVTKEIENWKIALDHLKRGQARINDSFDRQEDMESVTNTKGIDNIVDKHKSITKELKRQNRLRDQAIAVNDTMIQGITKQFKITELGTATTPSIIKSLVGDPVEAERIISRLEAKFSSMRASIKADPTEIIGKVNAYLGSLSAILDEELKPFVESKQAMYEGGLAEGGGMSGDLSPAERYKSLLDNVLSVTKRINESEGRLANASDASREHQEDLVDLQQERLDLTKQLEHLEKEMPKSVHRERYRGLLRDLEEVSMGSTELFKRKLEDDFAAIDKQVAELRSMPSKNDLSSAWINEELDAKLTIAHKALDEIEGHGTVSSKGGFTTQLDSFQGALSAAASARDQIEKAKGDKDDIKRSELAVHLKGIITAIDNQKLGNAAVVIGP